MKPQIIAACADVFFPELTESQRRSLVRALKASTNTSSFCQAVEKLFPSWPGESRLRLFKDFTTSLASASEYWQQGVDRDVLDAFPAARLIRETDETDSANWPVRWAEWGGRLYRAEMIALKWDVVWQHISDFHLPFPPFNLANVMGVEDVSRGDAEALRLIGPRSTIPRMSYDFDAPDFKKRLAAKLPPPLPTLPK